MKKFISLLTTLALLISICTLIPISVSAEEQREITDLSAYLTENIYRNGYIGEEPTQNSPTVAKITSFDEISAGTICSEYPENFFDNSFLLAVNWWEPQLVRTYNVTSLTAEDNNIVIELSEFFVDGDYPDAIDYYCAVIELPKTYSDYNFSVSTNNLIRIYTAEQLKAFADDVNSGDTYEGKTVVLDNDIDLSGICGEDINGAKVSWEPIGVDNLSDEEHTNIFNGEFDGRGHTIRGLYIYSEYSYDRYQGLFGYIGDNAVIRNLTLDGSVYVAAQGAEFNFDDVYPPSAFVGAIAGNGYGDIENCHNEANINVYGYISAGGGIIGRAYGNITGCSNNGTVMGVSSGLPSGTVDNVGGICGRFSGINSKINNCCNTAAVNGDLRVGGVVGSCSDGTIINCYNIGTVGGNKYVSAFVGENSREDSAVIENCYYLENCNADGTTFENDFGISKTAEQFASGEVAYLLGEAWGQEIGIDEYPVLGGDKVYFVNNTYTNTAPNAETNITEISTLEELEAFRDDVNSGNTYEGKTVRLTADIDMSEKYGEGKELWIPIGTEEHPFNGTFDGLCHTINIEVDEKSDAPYKSGGLFGYTADNAVIQRLTVSGSIYADGTIYLNIPSGTPRYIGAVANCNKGTIKNCSNLASVTYMGNYGNAGGIAGKTTGTIINCYSGGTATVAAQSDCGIASADDNTKIQNCYYLSSSENLDKYGAYGKTEEQFASGEVAYLLNGSKNYGGVTWYQDIHDDKFPTLNSVHAIVRDDGYNYYNPSIYSKDNVNKIKTHTVCVSDSNLKNAYKKIYTYDELLNTIYAEYDYNGITERYDKAFFKNKFLYIKYIDWGSSSNKYEIDSLWENGDDICVEISDISPRLTSDNVTYWLLIAEVDKSLINRGLKLEYLPYNVKYYYGRPPEKEFLPEDNLKLDYTVITSQEELDEQCGNISFLWDRTIGSSEALLIVSWQEPQSGRHYRISSIEYSKDGGYDITLSERLPSGKLSSDVLSDYCAAIAIPKSNADAKVSLRLANEDYPYKITDLRIINTAGEVIVKPETGKSFIVEADIIKTEERSEKDYLFVAVYGEDGALMSLDYVKAKFALDGECSFGFNIPAQDKAVGSVKAFVWNTFNSAEPLAEAKKLAPVVFE